MTTMRLRRTVHVGLALLPPWRRLWLPTSSYSHLTRAGARHDPGGLPAQPGAQRLGYSDAQRADWLRNAAPATAATMTAALAAR